MQLNNFIISLFNNIRNRFKYEQLFYLHYRNIKVWKCFFSSSQYASLFVHPSWRELLDGKEDDVTNEIVARILKYLNSGDNRFVSFTKFQQFC